MERATVEATRRFANLLLQAIERKPGWGSKELSFLIGGTFLGFAGEPLETDRGVVIRKGKVQEKE